MRHNQYAHKHKQKIMDETFFAWIERHKSVVVKNHAFHLDERPIPITQLRVEGLSKLITNFHS